MKTFFNWLTSFFKRPEVSGAPVSKSTDRLNEEAGSLYFFPVSNRIPEWARLVAERRPSVKEGYLDCRNLTDDFLAGDFGALNWINYIFLTREAESGLLHAHVPELLCLEIEPFDVSRYSDETEYFYQLRLWLLPVVNQLLVSLGRPIYDDHGYLCHMRSAISRDHYKPTLERVRSAYEGFPVIRRICYTSANGSVTSFFVDGDGKLLGAATGCNVFRHPKESYHSPSHGVLLCFNTKFRDVYEARVDKDVHAVHLDNHGLTMWLYPINSEYCSVRYIDKDGEKRILDNCETGERFIDTFYGQIVGLINKPVL